MRGADKRQRAMLVVINLEQRIPEGHPLRRVAVGGVARGVLAQPDHHEPPIELVAVAPLDHPQRGILGVPPGTRRIVEQGY